MVSDCRRAHEEQRSYVIVLAGYVVGPRTLLFGALPVALIAALIVFVLWRRNLLAKEDTTRVGDSVRKHRVLLLPMATAASFNRQHVPFDLGLVPSWPVRKLQQRARRLVLAYHSGDRLRDERFGVIAGLVAALIFLSFSSAEPGSFAGPYAWQALLVRGIGIMAPWPILGWLVGHFFDRHEHRCDSRIHARSPHRWSETSTPSSTTLTASRRVSADTMGLSASFRVFELTRCSRTVPRGPRPLCGDHVSSTNRDSLIPVVQLSRAMVSAAVDPRDAPRTASLLLPAGGAWFD